MPAERLLRRTFLQWTAAAPAFALPASTLDFQKLIPQRLPRSAVFAMEDYCLWDPSIARGDDGTHYLFFSRWPRSLGFDAWGTHAEIVYATSDQPEGPYRYRGTKNWRADQPVKRKDDWRIHRNNQQVDVAVADKLPGPWKRFEKPLIDTGPNTGYQITAASNVTVRPDGPSYLVAIALR